MDTCGQVKLNHLIVDTVNTVKSIKLNIYEYWRVQKQKQKQIGLIWYKRFKPVSYLSPIPYEIH